MRQTLRRLTGGLRRTAFLFLALFSALGVNTALACDDICVGTFGMITVQDGDVYYYSGCLRVGSTIYCYYKADIWPN